jgi:hypothetical protein
MRDDLFPLTKDQRRQAMAAWRRVRPQDRRDACRLAERGIRAPDDYVSWAARGYGQLLLQRNFTNRLPRCALTGVGLLTVFIGAVLGLQFDAGLGAAPVVAGGLVAAALGLLSWGQRRAAHVLVAANPEWSPAAAGEPRQSPLAPYSPQSKLPAPPSR